MSPREVGSGKVVENPGIPRLLYRGLLELADRRSGAGRQAGRHHRAIAQSFDETRRSALRIGVILSAGRQRDPRYAQG